MKRKYFGTDGIRGKANQGKMTPEISLRLGMAAGRYFRSGNARRHAVVVGKDTRLSGYALEHALVAGFASVGMDVILLSTIPTPGVAMMTRSLRADLGVMISASHNPYHDNGLKLFGPDGYKLSDEIELEIEALMDEPLNSNLARSDVLGRCHRMEEATSRYIEILKATFPRRQRLSGLRIVLDCANGAAYKVAPRALYELGAEVIPLGVSPNGFNINEEVGSTDTRALKEAVAKYRADIGIALDGDADRCIIVDEKANEIDGDQLLALIAQQWHAAGKLSKPGVVATVMSNLGLEHYLQGLGLTLERTQVGDRYVVEKMLADGYNLGGEPSGHMVLSDFSPTGDGMIAALQTLAAATQMDKPISEIANVFTPAPQKLINVRFGEKDPLEDKQVQALIKKVDKRLGRSGRLLIRKSGTEPLVRVMAEAEDPEATVCAAEEIAEAVRKVA
jgi:phosphoglucosamine mutase